MTHSDPQRMRPFREDGKASASPPEIPILEEVLRTTEHTVEGWDEEPSGEVPLAGLRHAARELKATGADEATVIQTLVGAATPAWLQTVLGDEAAWDALTGEIARLLASNSGARQRLLALYERLAESQG